LTPILDSTAKGVLEQLLRELEPHPYAHLASTCITRLKACGFQKSSIKTTKELEEALGRECFLGHAYKSWAYYTRKSEGSAASAQKSIHDFLVGCVSYPELVLWDAKDHVEHFTGLHLTAWHNLSWQLSKLIGKGHDCAKRTEGGGCTPLMVAASQGYSNIVEKLLRWAKAPGKDLATYINTVDNGGYDALLLALVDEHYDVAKVLLQTCACRPHAGSLKAYSIVLRDAASRGSTEAVKLLLTVPSIPVNAVGKSGLSALSSSALYGQLSSLEALLRFPGISTNIVDKEGKGLLRVAVEGGKVEIVEVLLRDSRIRVNATDVHGKTALMEAAKRGYVEVVNAILNVPGVNVNAKNHAGYTALMYATSEGKIEVVEALLKVGTIDVGAVDKTGKTALALTSKENRAAVDKLVKSRGTTRN
jgi:ankyrin repeat domain-containing protein 50